MIQKMQKPMTLEELKALPAGVIVWTERMNAGFTTLNQAYGFIVALVYGGDRKKKKYGKDIRAWRRLPTEEELAAAEWEV